MGREGACYYQLTGRRRIWRLAKSFCIARGVKGKEQRGVACSNEFDFKILSQTIKLLHEFRVANINQPAASIRSLTSTPKHALPASKLNTLSKVQLAELQSSMYSPGERRASSAYRPQFLKGSSGQ